MATISPESNSSIPHAFDLDLALTMADNSSSGVIEVPQSKSLASHEMPMVVVTAVGVCTVCMEVPYPLPRGRGRFVSVTHQHPLVNGAFT
ncbi:hypothetical protein F0562_009589 [Nyssa sinensis]|uniref:Uncharacterized protein n=1 Tax=Nyssa sinensis TaxID=561372 RepID=A0A5J4ZZD7_9ASTE|nr:hypothetical protein F0562_009589 [Nyssa sinensis]